MKKLKQALLLAVSLILLVGLLPGNAVTADGYGDYHAGDIQVINKLITENNLAFGGDLKVWENGVTSPPEGWDGLVDWNSETPKRIIEFGFHGFDTYGSGMLDLKGLAKLERLIINNGLMTGIDLEGLTSLEDIILFQDAKLEEVKTKGLSSLKYFDCNAYNPLTSLDFSDSPDLEDLSCCNYSLTNMVLGAKPKLEELQCMDCPLVNLDLSQATALKYLNCSGCQLSSLTLNPSAPYDTRIDVSYNLMTSESDVSGKSITWDGEDYVFEPQREKVTPPVFLEPFAGSGDRTVTFDVDEAEGYLVLRRNGKRVDESNYQVQAGSIVLTLKESYLKTLNPGTHRFSLEGEEFVGFFDLEVLGAEETTTTTTVPTTSTVPSGEEETQPTTAAQDQEGETKPATTAKDQAKDDVDVAVGESYNFLPLVLTLIGLTLLAVVLRLRTRKQN